ncbi:MAG: M14 family zinc carboxypeptidase [Gemmatimonadota bacterium]|nr:M14 family zinc carboxypeptidase [Gemmatimonadota bacterium]MDH3366710.1 M14 family zinc carboxypeptidase [Gemmatimonadota bacterium]MDH3478431.1 M14 family zinc carboxypeptidase [Gemmatimonadota bacterium]MDH3571131.1 M14 family zinc carboxypeptidase [Gemmatimonadota bacterium]MDH5550592.1 M14 family zinc carboxypeptidase [Gemmatimonadota bacterium]
MARTLARLTLALLLVAPLEAQTIPTPREYFGFEIGADRQLANWDQLTAWYQLLATRSDRVTLDTLGRTTLGLPFVMLTVTSPANHARLAELRDIQLRLADPRRIAGQQELGRLLDMGRTVVLVTHGVHATEVGGPQMAARLLHRLATSSEAKVREILDNVILLDIPSLNPDGLRMVVDWYRQWVSTEFEAAPLPMLYHFYIGHDNNRDWYAFTQIETELGVTKAHNAWHPQIVHDIHQMGSTGPRIFVPPFIDPWEPNIDPLLTAAVSQLGSYMAAEMLAQGLTGVAINAIYDAYTPARAYQHYHGGARILSETASIRIATPITVAPADLSTRRGLDVTQRSWNFPEVWGGGDWRLADIVDYMEAGVMALLSNAARNRRYWLENFYRINKRAVDGWPAWPAAWVLPGSAGTTSGLDAMLRILTIGDVEVHRATEAFEVDERRFAAGSYVIPMNQPYASFAQTLLERQVYPDLRLYPGGPPLPPYDVTAHTLPLLMGVDAVPVKRLPTVQLSAPIAPHEVRYETPAGFRGRDAPRIAVYKSWEEPMPEGWTRWVLDRHAVPYDTLHDADIRGGALRRYDVLLFEDQSPREIVQGWASSAMPAPYAGGLGEVGVAAVKQFVVGGGRVVTIGEATEFAIATFGLEVRNLVDGLQSREFYIPGSILRLQLQPGPLTEGVPPQTVTWFWRSSRAFGIADPRARVIGRYGSGDPLLSGWAMGQDRIAGQPALVEASVDRGSVVLFGFPPNYRGQTIASWPLLFNALRHRK